MTSAKAPVVFIHGLWLHASSWQPWQELFAEAGYEPSAPGWPGDADTVEATRAHPDAVANHGIDEVTNHYAGVIDKLPARPLFEAAAAAFSPHSPAQVNTGNQDRGPLLLTMGGKDHTVPEAITKSTVKQYRDSPAVTDLVEFADRGHSLTIDSGWREVAEACLAWLTKQGR